MSLRMLVLFGTLLSLAGVVPQQPDAALADRVIRRYCGLLSSDVDQERQAAQTQAAAAIGTPERLALLSFSDRTHPRCECAWTLLVLVRDFRVAPFLRDAIADPREEHRLVALAMSYLGQLDDPTSTEAIASFVYDTDPRLAIGAIRALGDLKNDRARSALRAALVDSRLNPFDVRAVIEMLGRQRDLAAVPLIVSAAGAPDATVHLVRAAAVALAAIGTPAAARSAVALVNRLPPGHYSRGLTAAEMVRGLTAARARSSDPEVRTELGEVIRRLTPIALERRP